MVWQVNLEMMLANAGLSGCIPSPPPPPYMRNVPLPPARESVLCPKKQLLIHACDDLDLHRRDRRAILQDMRRLSTWSSALSRCAPTPTDIAKLAEFIYLP